MKRHVRENNEYVHAHPDVPQHTVRKNESEKFYKFSLVVDAQRKILASTYKRSYYFSPIALQSIGLQRLEMHKTLLAITVALLHYDKHDWLEVKIEMTEFTKTQYDIPDVTYPKQSVRIAALTNDTGFEWLYDFTSPIADGLLLYHKPRENEQAFDILVEIQKAKHDTCREPLPVSNFDQMCVLWKSELLFSSETAAHMISLPGNHFQHIKLTNTHQVKSSSIATLHAYWPPEHCPFAFLTTECFSSCKNGNYYENHTFFGHKSKRIVFHYIYLLQHFCDPKMNTYNWPLGNNSFEMNISRNLNGTWNEASELCKSEGGTLPIIRTIQEHDQLITLCRCGLTIMEILFIGLFNNPTNKVNL